MSSRDKRFFRLPARTDAAVDADIDEELDSLIAARVEHLMARGMAYDDARAEATRRLGDSLDAVRRQLHHSAHQRERRMRLDEHLDNLVHDLRYAARGLMRRPAFTTIAVLTLAIGIGATTAIFSAVDTLIVRSLPYRNPDELMKVSLTIPPRPGFAGREDLVWSYPKFAMFRTAQQVFSDLSLYTSGQGTITSGDVELVRFEQVGATYLRTLGVTPVAGRDFDPRLDDHADNEKQIIITNAFWQRRFNADPNIIGKVVDLDRQPYVIIGLTAPGFAGLTGRADFFLPITSRPTADLSEADSHEFYAVGRRKPGITLGAAVAAVDALGKQVHDAFAQSRMGNGWTVRARPLDDARVAPLVRRSLLVLLGAAGFLLLIACVNVANLLLARAGTRKREIAVRVAIGAGRGRLIRLLLTESVLLALVGGAASVFVAWAGTRALAAINPAVLLRVGGLGGLGAITFASIGLDWATLGFTFVITLVVGVLFGLLPALEAARTSLVDAMKGVTSTGRAPGRRVLVVGEVALALVLLAGSGLMIRSLSKLLAIDTGYDGRHVLTLRMTIPPGGGVARDSMPGFYEELLNRVRAIPGVTDAAINNCPPLNGGCNGTMFERMDRPEGDPLKTYGGGSVHWASPSWFSTMGVSIKQGRTFASTDRLGAPKVIVINETAAKTLYPGENPLGKRLGVGQGGFGDGAEIVGVVGNVRQWVDSMPKPQVYIPYAQSPRPGTMVFIRAAGDPLSLVNDVRRVLREVAPQTPVYDILPMTTRAASATAQARFNAILLTIFAATALSLAAIGIYGVMSLAVAARTRELGIRMALGADQGRVRRLVVNEGLTLVGVGAAIGLVVALLSTRVLSKMLFDLEPSDPITYVGILILLSGTAILASWVPARRASRVDPVIALKAE